MLNVYQLLKLNRRIQSKRLKDLGIWVLHSFGFRYIVVFLDPVLACNLRCRMCYFSSEEKRKTYRGKFSKEDLPLISNAFFHRALKLQIGCGAEPSLFAHNEELIKLGKAKKIPYISMTTNANLFSEQDWERLLEAGLNEVTLSLHGVTQESYEHFMPGGSWEKFTDSLSSLNRLKDRFPDFRIRINYTANNDNFEELGSFFNIFDSIRFDIIQVRPIIPMENSDYQNFSWDIITEKYDIVIEPLKKICQQKGITFIAPSRSDLTNEKNDNNSLAGQTYCYISPRSIWKDGFVLGKDSFESYSGKNHIGWKYLKKVFQKKRSNTNKRNLNYEVV